MGLRNAFNVVLDLISAIKDIAITDDKFRDSMIEAVGVISLVAMGIKLCEKIHEKSKSDGERAYASLLKFIFRSADACLTEIEKTDLKGRIFCPYKAQASRPTRVCPQLVTTKAIDGIMTVVEEIKGFRNKVIHAEITYP